MNGASKYLKDTKRWWNSSVLQSLRLCYILDWNYVSVHDRVSTSSKLQALQQFSVRECKLSKTGDPSRYMNHIFIFYGVCGLFTRILFTRNFRERIRHVKEVYIGILQNISKEYEKYSRIIEEKLLLLNFSIAGIRLYSIRQKLNSRFLLGIS